uniref:Deoxynucleoside kinase domain-containing protein n=1 Tax=viral metagenome TaxID=1070528 RepID=A0A6C0ESE8_9ZZZZ
MTTQIVSIEGNIGSGKSTLLEFLRNEFNNNPKIIFLKEPVEEWSTIIDENNVTILQKFYNDQDKYSFPFQMMAYISRLALLKETIQNNPGSIIVTERSLYTDRLVFAKMLFDSGKIELINYRIYLKWFDTFASDFPVDKVIYVKTDPDICHQRILKRSRTGEDSIPLTYLTNCHEYHNNMLINTNNDFVCENKLLLDGNIDIYENQEKLQDWIKKITDFIL